MPVVRPAVAAASAPWRSGSGAPVGSIQVTDLPLAESSQRDAHGDPRQPRAERAVAAPAGERPIGGHECLLGDVLGLVQVAEDAMARSDDRRRLALDEVTEGVAIAGEDGIHDRAVALVIVGSRAGR